MEFLDNGRIDKVSVDADQSDDLVKLLDAVVIRLEGGTDLDLKILDQVLGKQFRSLNHGRWRIVGELQETVQ